MQHKRIQIPFIHKYINFDYIHTCMCHILVILEEILFAVLIIQDSDIGWRINGVEDKKCREWLRINSFRCLSWITLKCGTCALSTSHYFRESVSSSNYLINNLNWNDLVMPYLYTVTCFIYALISTFFFFLFYDIKSLLPILTIWCNLLDYVKVANADFHSDLTSTTVNCLP